MVPTAHARSSVSAVVEDGVFVFVFLLVKKNVAELRFRLNHNVYYYYYTCLFETCSKLRYNEIFKYYID